MAAPHPVPGQERAGNFEHDPGIVSTSTHGCSEKLPAPDDYARIRGTTVSAVLVCVVEEMKHGFVPWTTRVGREVENRPLSVYAPYAAR